MQRVESKKKSATYRKSLRRLLFIDKQLTGRRFLPVSTLQLVEEWGESGEDEENERRNFQRHLKFLKNIGAPIKYDREQKGYYYERRDFELSSTDFIKRLLIIDHEIRHMKYPNPKILAERFGVTEKTIKRDIEFLKLDAKAPIEYDRRQKGYFYSNLDYRVPHIRKLLE